MSAEINRVGIIGTGVSGLSALRWCIQDGFQCTAYEKSAGLGGLWRFEEYVRNGRASCMKSTVLNTGKEISAFSDFPPKESIENYMRNSVYLQYLEDYAREFDLSSHICFNHEVKRVEKRGQKWTIEVLNLADGTKKNEEFDAVMVCTGNYSYPNVPSFDGLGNFRGSVAHSHQIREYLCSEKYQDKRVLVVGVGASGTDVACEAAKVAAKVYLVSRRGMWIVSRYASGGYPIDAIYNNRFTVILRRSLGRRLTESLYKKKINREFDHGLYGIEPLDFGPFEDRPHICDAIWNDLATGKTSIVRDSISNFTQTGVRFSSGLQLDDIDHVIMCTGYEVDFPFLGEELFKDVRQVGAEGPLRACARQLVHAAEPTLAFIGFIMPQGPALPVIEMQARVITSLWKQRVSVDRVIDAYRAISAIEKRLFQRNPQIIESTAAKNGSLVHYGLYLDTMAEIIGCKPPLVRFLLTDFRLWHALMFSSWTSYQYRLRGPNSWSGARDAILGQNNRIKFIKSDSYSSAHSAASKKHPSNLAILFLLISCVSYLLLRCFSPS